MDARAFRRRGFSRDIRGEFDVVLFFNIGTTLPSDARANLTAFVEGGGGVVVLHHALASYPDWPWWYEQVVGGRYLTAPDGDQPASTYRQDEEIIAIPTRDHPVTASLGGFPIHMYDETYQGMWISPESEVLLRTGLSTSDGPIVWLGPHEWARVVVIQPGHGSGAHLNLAFRTILRHAVLWSSRGSG